MNGTDAKNLQAVAQRVVSDPIGSDYNRKPENKSPLATRRISIGHCRPSYTETIEDGVYLEVKVCDGAGNPQPNAENQKIINVFGAVDQSAMPFSGLGWTAATPLTFAWFAKPVMVGEVEVAGVLVGMSPLPVPDDGANKDYFLFWDHTAEGIKIKWFEGETFVCEEEPP